MLATIFEIVKENAAYGVIIPSSLFGVAAIIRARYYGKAELVRAQKEKDRNK